jgi:DNA mismatch repair ATPase MutS
MKPVKGKPNSMFEILNCCVTSSGMNMLKSYLLQPSAELAVINQRLDIVEELVRNQSVSSIQYGIINLPKKNDEKILAVQKFYPIIKSNINR